MKCCASGDESESRERLERNVVFVRRKRQNANCAAIFCFPSTKPRAFDAYRSARRNKTVSDVRGTARFANERPSSKWSEIFRTTWRAVARSQGVFFESKQHFGSVDERASALESELAFSFAIPAQTNSFQPFARLSYGFPRGRLLSKLRAFAIPSTRSHFFSDAFSTRTASFLSASSESSDISSPDVSGADTPSIRTFLLEL